MCNEEEKGNGSQSRELQLKLGLNQLNSTKLSLSADSLGFSQTDYNWGNGIQRLKLVLLKIVMFIYNMKSFLAGMSHTALCGYPL